MNTIKLTRFAFLMAGTLTMANAAYAATGSMADRAELSRLSPELRTAVQARVGKGETLHSVLEVMLLNNLPMDVATRHIVATNFEKGQIVTVGKDGVEHKIPFNPKTLQPEQT
jgi:hypothetical protein